MEDKEEADEEKEELNEREEEEEDGAGIYWLDVRDDVGRNLWPDNGWSGAMPRMMGRPHYGPQTGSSNK